MDILMKLDFEAFRQRFLFYLKPLANFEFSFFNPIFWICLLLIFLILLQIWPVKKSFHFCLLLAFILLCTTKIESRFVASFPTNQLFDATTIKLISSAAVMLLLLFYIFLI